MVCTTRLTRNEHTRSRFHLNNNYLQTIIYSSYVTNNYRYSVKRKVNASSKIIVWKSILNTIDFFFDIQTCRKERRVNWSACYRLDSKIRSRNEGGSISISNIDSSFFTFRNRPVFHRGNRGLESWPRWKGRGDFYRRKQLALLHARPIPARRLNPGKLLNH